MILYRQREEHYMYKILALLAGIVITIQISVNGGLNMAYGLYTSTVIIHLVGTVVALIALKITGQKLKSERFSKILYLGGMLGVFCVVANNYCFTVISMSAISGLMLLSQSLASMIVDHYGFFGMDKRPYQKNKLIGLTLILIGIIIMCSESTSSDILAITLAFMVGCILVITRALNGKLSKIVGPLKGSFINHYAGLFTATIVFLILGRNESIINLGFLPTVNPIYLIGGGLGVIIVLISNIVIVKESSFYVSLLMFIGQIGTSIIVDTIRFGTLNYYLVFGTVFILIGLIQNLLLDRKTSLAKNVSQTL